LRSAHALMLVIALALITPAWAQETTPTAPEAPQTPVEPAAPAVVQPAEPPAPLPTISPETAILKRTPAVNGQVEPGEWDTYFSFDYGDVHAWTYVNWDDNNLYVASKSTKPTDLLVILDANCDGWFHGPDNYEFTIRRGQGEEAPTLSVSRYESQGPPGTAGAPLAATETTAFVMKAGSAPDSYVYELAIPKSSVAGLDLRSARKIGLKVAVGVGGPDVQWIPPAPLGEVQTPELVAAKSAASSPLKVDVALRDRRLTPGEELVAKISIRNSGDAASAADAVVVGGEGKTAKLLGSQLIRLDGIAPGKGFTCTFRTPVSRSAAPGSGALGVEVRSGEERIATSLVSFDIVPAYEVKLDLGIQPVKRGNYHRLAVIVRNNTRREAYGKVKLTMPEGWVFWRSRGVKEFSIQNEDSEQAVVFRVKPPSDGPSPAPVVAEMQVGKELLSASGTLEVK